jgi:hypothetical protein
MPIGKKIRIYDLARELKQDAKRVMEDLRREGADVSVPSNSVSGELADKIRTKYFPKQDAAPKRGIKVIKAAKKEESPEIEEHIVPEAVGSGAGPVHRSRGRDGTVGRASRGGTGRKGNGQIQELQAQKKAAMPDEAPSRKLRSNLKRKQPRPKTCRRRPKKCLQANERHLPKQSRRREY